jgi:hypothetical protein
MIFYRFLKAPDGSPSSLAKAPIRAPPPSVFFSRSGGRPLMAPVEQTKGNPSDAFDAIVGMRVTL